jgi:hypothetical protein
VLSLRGASNAQIALGFVTPRFVLAPTQLEQANSDDDEKSVQDRDQSRGSDRKEVRATNYVKPGQEPKTAAHTP